jgi:hypothetical protein
MDHNDQGIRNYDALANPAQGRQVVCRHCVGAPGYCPEMAAAGL